jgi:hypothetical protein
MTQLSPYEADIHAQPGALRAYGASAPPDLDGSGYERIVLTGMGASHFAAVPTWRRLTAAGYPAWWVSTTQLLDTPELVTPGTLLIATSQSGASGEITQILPGGALPARPRTLVGVTNDPGPAGRRRHDRAAAQRQRGHRQHQDVPQHARRTPAHFLVHLTTRLIPPRPGSSPGPLRRSRTTTAPRCPPSSGLTASSSAAAPSATSASSCRAYSSQPTSSFSGQPRRARSRTRRPGRRAIGAAELARNLST